MINEGDTSNNNLKLRSNLAELHYSLKPISNRIKQIGKQGIASNKQWSDSFGKDLINKLVDVDLDNQEGKTNPSLLCWFASSTQVVPQVIFLFQNKVQLNKAVNSASR